MEKNTLYSFPEMKWLFSEKSWKLILITIPMISFFLHFRIFSLELIGPHVWRQTQTQTNILNFAREDMNILNPKVNNNADTDRIQRMEFPLMQWIYAWPYKWFGNHVIISRVLTFIMGLFSVWGMYRFLFFIFHIRLVASLGAWAFNFSPLFYYYTLNPLPDNMALCLGLWGLSFFLHYQKDAKLKHLIFSAILFGISVAVKLPFILCMTFPGYYLLHKLFTKNQKLKTFGQGVIFILMVIPAAVWYVWVIPQWKSNPVIKGVYAHQKPLIEIIDILQSHIISNLAELYINYASFVFFITGLILIFKKSIWKNSIFQSLALWGIATILYFLFEITAIGKEHDYYMFPFLPLFFILVASGIKFFIFHENKVLNYLTIFALILTPLTAFLRADSRWNPEKPSVNIDLYRNKDELRNLVPDDALCVVGNDLSQHIFLYYIDKKGFVFDQDLLNGEMLKIYINKGATFLFSDSRSDERDDVILYLDQLVFHKGSLKVFKLKSLDQI